MEQEWIGIEGKCDVVVCLVKRLAYASADQGCAVMGEKKTRKRKRSFEPGDEDEEIVGYFHVQSNHLRRCSKYFDTCFSKEWLGADLKPLVHLSLDVHADVEYYRECFSRMHSSHFWHILHVEHGLKLLQVASQISYLSLAEECVQYLASVLWSQEDERRIREFANSMFYPSDCAGDLSARLGLPSSNTERQLGLPLSNTERHSLLCNVIESAICQHFDDVMIVGYDGQEDPINSSRLFSTLFQKIIAGPYQSILENVLKHIHACVRKIILEAIEDPGFNQNQEFSNVRWILGFLFETGFATELVEIIVMESPLSELLKEACYYWKMSWLDIIYDVFQEVLIGQMMLKTSTRYMLLQNWMWILDFGVATHDQDFEDKIPRMLKNFVLTFPLEMQKEIFCGWLTYFKSKTHSHGLSFLDLRTNWIDKLLEETTVSTIEPLGSASCEGDTELSEKGTIRFQRKEHTSC